MHQDTWDTPHLSNPARGLGKGVNACCGPAAPRRDRLAVAEADLLLWLWLRLLQFVVSETRVVFHTNHDTLQDRIRAKHTRDRTRRMRHVKGFE